MYQSRLVGSDQADHLLQGVGSPGDGLLAAVALPPSPGVVGDPLAVTVVTDDVALQDDQLNVRNYQLFSSYLTTLLQSHGRPRLLCAHWTLKDPSCFLLFRLAVSGDSSHAKLQLGNPPLNCSHLFSLLLL